MVARVDILNISKHFYLFIDLVKVPTEEKHMHVYNKGEQLHIYIYLLFWLQPLFRDQPVNNGFVISKISTLATGGNLRSYLQAWYWYDRIIIFVLQIPVRFIVREMRSTSDVAIARI